MDHRLRPQVHRPLCTMCCSGHSLLGQDVGCPLSAWGEQCPWTAQGNPGSVVGVLLQAHCPSGLARTHQHTPILLQAGRQAHRGTKGGLPESPLLHQADTPPPTAPQAAGPRDRIIAPPDPPATVANSQKWAQAGAESSFDSCASKTKSIRNPGF